MKKAYPYAVASMLLGIISYIQLLGIERAILAIVFGVIALRKIKESAGLSGEKYAYWGIGLGIVYMVIVLVFVLVKGVDIVSIVNSLIK